MIDIEDNDDEFSVNDNVYSECCGSSIYGEIIDDLGICSKCKEWTGVIRRNTEEDAE